MSKVIKVPPHVTMPLMRIAPVPLLRLTSLTRQHRNDSEMVPSVPHLRFDCPGAWNSLAMVQLPFTEYATLPRGDVEVVWGNPSDPSCFPAGDFDIVIDNNGKDIDACKPLIDTYGSKASPCNNNDPPPPPPLHTHTHTHSHTHTHTHTVTHTHTWSHTVTHTHGHTRSHTHTHGRTHTHTHTHTHTRSHTHTVTHTHGHTHTHTVTHTTTTTTTTPTQLNPICIPSELHCNTISKIYGNRCKEANKASSGC